MSGEVMSDIDIMEQGSRDESNSTFITQSEQVSAKANKHKHKGNEIVPVVPKKGTFIWGKPVTPDQVNYSKFYISKGFFFFYITVMYMILHLTLTVH